MNIQNYFAKQEVILQYIQQHKLTKKDDVRIYFAFFILLFIAVLILVTFVGGMLYALNLSSSWFEHQILPWLVITYLLLTLLIIIFIELYQYRQFYLKRAVLPLWIDVEEIKNHLNIGSSAHEYYLYKLNQSMADFFQVSALPIYIISQSEEINVSSYQWNNQASIIITWQAVYQLHRPEIIVLLYTQYMSILLGEVKQRSRVYHLLFGFNLGVAHVFKKSSQYKKKYFARFFTKIYKRIGLVLFSADYILQVKFKRGLYYSLCQENDIIYIQFLKNPMIYLSLLQQCTRSVECRTFPKKYYPQLDILSFCANNYLYKIPVYPKISQRLSLLSKYYQSFDPMVKTAYTSRYNGVLYYIQLMQGKPLSQVYQQYEQFNIYSLKYSVPIYSQHSHLNNDTIRPLNPNLRKEKAVTQYFNKIFATQAHYLHSISLILMLRKNPQLNMNDLDISTTVCMALKSVDERLYIQIFQQSLSYIDSPKMIAKEHLKQWFAIIHHNDSMSLIDALLFEKLKYQCVPFIPQHYCHELEVLNDVIALIQGLTFIQPYQQHSTAYKFKIFQLFYYKLDLEAQGINENIFDNSVLSVNYHQVLSRLFSMSEQNRVFLLYLIEQLLLEYGILTQEGFDVLLLLYWRFGFSTEEFEMQLYKRSQNMLFIIE